MAPPAADPPSLALSAPGGRRRLPAMQEIGLLIVVFLLYSILTWQGFVHRLPGAWNAFLNLDNQINGIGLTMSVYGIMAVGMTCVIITGGIDISVGSIFGVCQLAGAYVLQYLPTDAPGYLVFSVAVGVPVLVGGICGAANGALTVGLRVHSFIVTLATLGIIRGLGVLIFPSTVPVMNRQLPESFVRFMDYGFGGGLRLMPTIVLLLVVAAGSIFLHTMVAGRETYAIGGNVEAARYSGIRVWWVTLRVYVLMGICCGIAAFVDLGRFHSAQTKAGEGYELTVIAAAVIGGASLVGGKGTALGAFLGTLIIFLIQNGIPMMHLSTEYTKVIVGTSILIVVAIDRISDHVARRRGMLQ